MSEFHRCSHYAAKASLLKEQSIGRREEVISSYSRKGRESGRTYKSKGEIMNTITTKDGTQIYFKDWDGGQPIVSKATQGNINVVTNII